MAVDPKAEIEKLLSEALQAKAPQSVGTPIVVERPKQADYGDFSSNVALQAAKREKKKPRDLALELAAFISAKASASGSLSTIDKVEVAGPGFINFKLKTGTKSDVIRRILEEGRDYGRGPQGRGEKVQVEFVSANPTGPLHVGHGRQAALGDAIAALLESQGHAVTREFYYNDAGAQIEKLALSVQARGKGIRPGEAGWPEEGYNGEYIEDIARDFLSKKGKATDLDAIRKFAVAYLRAEQDVDLQAFGVKFDVYYLESSLYAEGKVDQTVKTWAANRKTYEKDGALWLRTTAYGDDKDRVVRKSDGSYTYFVPDVAYHVTKWQLVFWYVSIVVF
jgi:arginyl-tRNA synthetase